MQNKLINTVRFINALISGLVALAAIPLMVADYMKPLEDVNSTLAHYWPIFLAAATIIDRAGKMLISLLIRWFPAAAATVLCLAFAGCGTTLYNPRTGGKLAVMRSDITTGDYNGGGVRFTFAKMNNSSPTRAALLGANRIVGTVGSAAVSVLVPGTGATPAITRTVISSVPHIVSPKDTNTSNP